MDFEPFMATGWDEHATSPRAVADRLSAQGMGLASEPAHCLALMRLMAHIWGEHLGDWDEGARRLRAVTTLPAWDHSPALSTALARHLASLAWCAGRPEDLEALAPEDRMAALAQSAAALAGRSQLPRALAAHDAAWALLDTHRLADDSPAWRALAVGGHNLAVALEELPERDDATAAGMVRAAEASVQAWRHAGTWLEVERAEYRLARSLMKAGEARKAQAAAGRCVAICQAQDAPAFERFFAHAVLALAARQAGDTSSFAAERKAAIAWQGQVPAEEQSWCQADRAELE